MQIFAGWLSAATFVSFPSTLVWAGVTLVDPRSNLVAIAAIAGAAVLACAVIAATRALAYAATISWAIIGVIIANLFRDDRPAIVAFAVAAGVTVISFTIFAFTKLSKKWAVKT